MKTNITCLLAGFSFQMKDCRKADQVNEYYLDARFSSTSLFLNNSFFWVQFDHLFVSIIEKILSLVSLGYKICLFIFKTENSDFESICNTLLCIKLPSYIVFKGHCDEIIVYLLIILLMIIYFQRSTTNTLTSHTDVLFYGGFILALLFIFVIGFKNK